LQEDRRDDLVPGRAGRVLVPNPVQPKQASSWDLRSEGFAVCIREERIVRAVDDERGRPNLSEPSPHGFALLHD
jgi:hypothetical protein